MKTHLLTFALVVCSFWLGFLWAMTPPKTEQPLGHFENGKQTESAQPSHESEVIFEINNELSTDEMKHIINRRDLFRRGK